MCEGFVIKRLVRSTVVVLLLGVVIMVAAAADKAKSELSAANKRVEAELAQHVQVAATSISKARLSNYMR